MNRERQKQVDDYAAQAARALARNRISTNSIAEMGIGLQKLIAVEELSIARMLPHREKPSTSANINKAERVVATLQDAVVYLGQQNLAKLTASLQSLEGTAAPRRPPLEIDVTPDPEVWPGDFVETTVIDEHARALGLYKEYEQRRLEEVKLQDSRYQQWLQENGHADVYKYVHHPTEFIRSEKHRPLGHSNRPEDY